MNFFFFCTFPLFFCYTFQHTTMKRLREVSPQNNNNTTITKKPKIHLSRCSGDLDNDIFMIVSSYIKYLAPLYRLSKTHNLLTRLQLTIDGEKETIITNGKHEDTQMYRHGVKYGRGSCSILRSWIEDRTIDHMLQEITDEDLLISVRYVIYGVEKVVNYCELFDTRCPIGHLCRYPFKSLADRIKSKREYKNGSRNGLTLRYNEPKSVEYDYGADSEPFCSCDMFKQVTQKFVSAQDRLNTAVVFRESQRHGLSRSYRPITILSTPLNGSITHIGNKMDRMAMYDNDNLQGMQREWHYNNGSRWS